VCCAKLADVFLSSNAEAFSEVIYQRALPVTRRRAEGRRLSQSNSVICQRYLPVQSRVCSPSW